MYSVNIFGQRIINRIKLSYGVIVLDNGPSPKNFIEVSESELRPETVILEEPIQTWLDENIKGHYRITPNEIIFDNLDEAVLFRITWSSTNE